jgi:hypothetical protein
MSERRVIISEEVLRAAQDTWMIFGDYPVDPSRFRRTVLPVIEAAICSAVENPPKVDVSSCWNVAKAGDGYDMDRFIRCLLKRVFLAPEPEFPKEIADLRFGEEDGRFDKALIEAFNRGKKVATK